MMRKSPVEILVSVDGQCCDWSCLLCKLARKLWKGMEHTGVVFAKNTPILKLEKEKVCLKRK